MKLHIIFSVVVTLVAYSNYGALTRQGGTRDCPAISVSHPELSSKDRTLTYRATIQSGDQSVTPTFKWTVSAGKIIRGQGTSAVSVDAEGNRSLTVTVEVNGYPANCQNKASYSWVAD